VFPSLGTVFSEAGYETGYIGKWHLPYNVRQPETHGFLYTGNIKNNGIDNTLAASATEFLKKQHEKPFLFVASFVNPHNICEWARGQDLPDGAIGSPPLADDCPPLRLNHAPSGNETDIMQQLRRSYQAARMFPVSEFSDDKWRQYTWAYYRMIEKVDAEISRILNVLQESGLARNTIVVLLNDHGDCQGAHLWNQKTVFFEEAAKVPFIISHESLKPGKSDYLVQTGIDLLPTLCDLAGIPLEISAPGTSLRQLLTSGTPKDERDYIVVSDRLIQGDTIDGHRPQPNGRMLRTERFKYWILDEGVERETLYDLKNDPGEMKNIAGDPEFRKEVEECRRKLAEWALKYKDSFTGGIAE
jgi:choline-sulfatase